jgi:hypothetical protein
MRLRLRQAEVAHQFQGRIEAGLTSALALDGGWEFADVFGYSLVVLSFVAILGESGAGARHCWPWRLGFSGRPSQRQFRLDGRKVTQYPIGRGTTDLIPQKPQSRMDTGKSMFL